MKTRTAAALAFALLALPAGAGAQSPPAAYCGPKLYETYPLPQPFGPSLAQAACRPYVVEAPGKDLYLAVALSQADRERGLMYVHALPENDGMFFAFPGGDQPLSFWMKNTLVPLDMIFIHSDGRISAIFDNVPSSTFDMPDDKVAERRGVGKYVIELRAGEAKRAGLRAGLRLLLPALSAPIS
jgi:uncharacterized membrane protein (UPF0127 family)